MNPKESRGSPMMAYFESWRRLKLVSALFAVLALFMPVATTATPGQAQAQPTVDQTTDVPLQTTPVATTPVVAKDDESPDLDEAPSSRLHGLIVWVRGKWRSFGVTRFFEARSTDAGLHSASHLTAVERDDGGAEAEYIIDLKHDDATRGLTESNTRTDSATVIAGYQMDCNDSGTPFASLRPNLELVPKPLAGEHDVGQVRVDSSMTHLYDSGGAEAACLVDAGSHAQSGPAQHDVGKHLARGLLHSVPTPVGDQMAQGFEKRDAVARIGANQDMSGRSERLAA